MNYTDNAAYVLEYLTLDFEQGELDLKDIFIAINLYESIEEPGMNGYIAVLDTFNLPDIAPLYGNEKIKFRFHTAGHEDTPIEYEGIVYKVGTKEQTTEHGAAYILYFCSEHVLKSRRTFTNQYYNGSISDIVTKIYSKYLKTTKLLEVVPTKGNYTYTFGSIEPLDAISLMSPKAVSTESDHSYMFFETSGGFMFAPLQLLYKQDPVADYGYRNAGVHKDVSKRHEEQFETIQGIEFFDENSLMDRYQDGIHGSDHFMFDLKSKVYLDSEATNYNKAIWFDESKSLGAVPDKRDVEQAHDVIFFSVGYGELDILNHKDYIEDKMKLRESDMFRANIQVMGDSILKAGDCITVTLPNWNQDQEAIGTLFDGKVLIKKLCHILTPTAYTQTMQINKDAYERSST